MAEKLKGQLRPDELIQDAEVRNHVSLPGALLWIVTAGIVSHHSVDLRGRIVTAKELPPPPTPAERGAAPPSITNINIGRDDYGRGPTAAELVAVSTIDRPLADVARDFDAAAARAGLTPIARVKWDEVSAATRTDYDGEIPSPRLMGVEPSKIQSFCVANESLVRDAKSDPKRAAHLPCVVCYESGEKTQVLYARPTVKLRALEARGFVGEGKWMSREEFDRHFEAAQDFERCCEKLVENLKTAS